MKKTEEALSQTGWKRKYVSDPSKKPISVNSRMFLALLPEAKLSATLEYMGKRLLS
jgi:hypothetical protein